MERKYKIFLLILLGAFTAFAPLINNTFGPILGLVAKHFQSANALVNVGFTAGMVGLAVGQLVLGPLSDKYGRRRPLFVAVSLFFLASLAVAYAPNMESFIALRFVQGFGGAGGIVISRSIAADNFSGHQLMTVIAITGCINGVAPIVAPMASGAMAGLMGWQGTFFMLAAIGLLMAVGTYYLRESLPDGRRINRPLFATFRLYGTVVRNKQYILYVLHQCTAEVILFGNIASVWSILSHYGYTNPGEAGIALSVNGIFIAIGAGGAAKFSKATTGVKVSCAGMLLFSAIEAVVLFLDLGFWPYEIVLCILLTFMGFTLTASTTMALDSERRQVGTASALFGAMGFVSGALASPLVALGNPVHSTAIAFLFGAILSCIFGYFALRQTAKSESRA
ncbi:MAG: MFS transporter [bacterium]|nr:MFS transporter [bacterium]